MKNRVWNPAVWVVLIVAAVYAAAEQSGFSFDPGSIVKYIIGAAVGAGLPVTIGGVVLWAVKKVKWKKLAVKVGDMIYFGPYQKIDGKKSEGAITTLMQFIVDVVKRIQENDKKGGVS